MPPAKVEELFAATAGNQFASINRPTAGAREEKALPEGKAPLQLYSLGTPNGNKVHVLLEELGVDYDAFTINIGNGAQFTSGFVAVNPNSKIPCLVDKEGPDGRPISLFESGSINLYLCEKYKRFLPENPRLRTEVMNWVFWQMAGQGPFTGGGFGHFFAYAPGDQLQTRDYGVARFGMEVLRLCDVLDKHLEGKQYLVGEEYSLADIMCWPWFYQLETGYKHGASGLMAGDFLTIQRFKNCTAWSARILAREAVKRAITVCSWTTPHPKPWLAPKA